MIAYTGLRWGQAIGLEQDLVQPGELSVEWQLREVGSGPAGPPGPEAHPPGRGAPGSAVAAWPPAEPGSDFAPPNGRGTRACSPILDAG